MKKFLSITLAIILLFNCTGDVFAIDGFKLLGSHRAKKRDNLWWVTNNIRAKTDILDKKMKNAPMSDFQKTELELAQKYLDGTIAVLKEAISQLKTQLKADPNNKQIEKEIIILGAKVKILEEKKVEDLRKDLRYGGITLMVFGGLSAALVYVVKDEVMRLVLRQMMSLTTVAGAILLLASFFVSDSPRQKYTYIKNEEILEGAVILSPALFACVENNKKDAEINIEIYDLFRTVEKYPYIKTYASNYWQYLTALEKYYGTPDYPSFEAAMNEAAAGFNKLPEKEKTYPELYARYAHAITNFTATKAQLLDDLRQGNKTGLILDFQS